MFERRCCFYWFLSGDGARIVAVNSDLNGCLTMLKTCGLITLLSDFGSTMGYVAQMKGVILRLNPQARLVDIDHAIPPQNIACAALTLEQSAPCFPDGSVHLAVVDPGVGGPRRALIVETESAYFAGPDNGLFGFLRNSDKIRAVYEIDAYSLAPQGFSRTFHGRDIFAPASARLSLGESPQAFARLSDDPPLELPQPEAHLAGGCVEGRVLCADAFGNLLTSIKRADIELLAARRPGAVMRVRFKLTEIPLLATYSEVPPGGLLAYIGSGGHLEIARNCGNAQTELAAAAGDALQLEFG